MAELVVVAHWVTHYLKRFQDKVVQAAAATQPVRLALEQALHITVVAAEAGAQAEETKRQAIHKAA